MGTTRNQRDRSCIPNDRLFGEVTPGPAPTLEPLRRPVTCPAFGDGSSRSSGLRAMWRTDPLALGTQDPAGSKSLIRTAIRALHRKSTFDLSSRESPDLSDLYSKNCVATVPLNSKI